MKAYKEEGYTVQPLKDEGIYSIDKVTEKDGNIYYDIYDQEQNLVNTFRSIKEARNWCKMMQR